MRTGEIIASLEHSYTTSFQHTARVKWRVNFETSNVQSVLTNLQQLKHNLTTIKPKPCKVGYELTLQDVERVEAMLNELLQRWKQLTNIPPHPKLYTFLDELRGLETPTIQQQAHEVLKEAFKPAPQPTKKAQKQADIEELKQQRAVEMLRKQNKIN